MLEGWWPPDGLAGSKELQCVIASAAEPLTERGKCRPVLLGAGRHCFALCSPLQQPSHGPGVTAAPFPVCLQLLQVSASCMVLPASV